MSSMASFARGVKGMETSCLHLFCCIFPTITSTAQFQTNLDPRRRLRITIWQWGASSRQFHTVPIGTTRRSSLLKMMHKTVPIMLTPTGLSLSRSASIRPVPQNESLLGLPPMNQNDAYAPVMAPLFSGPGDHPPFTADWSNQDTGLIYQTNTPKQQGAKQSAKMNFARPDAINTAVLNKILWHDRKGDFPMPEPKHTVVPQTKSRDDD